jgi:uncharacterized damage-inducible protein DinB
MLEKWAAVRAGLLDTIEKFTDADLAFWPFPGAYSVAETILHIAHEEAIEIGWGLSRRLPEMPPAYDSTEFTTLTQIEDVLRDVHDQTVEYLAGLSDEELGADTELAWGGRTRPSDMLLHTLEHEIHHRGELSLILGLLGRKGLDA